MSVELIGPLAKYTGEWFQVAVGGKLVPHIRVTVYSPIRFGVLIDERMEHILDCDKAALDGLLAFSADFGAVCAGRSCFAGESPVRDLFNVKVGRMTMNGDDHAKP